MYKIKPALKAGGVEFKECDYLSDSDCLKKRLSSCIVGCARCGFFGD